MPCDPKKIFTDLDVIGVTLTYTNIWVAGTMKALSSINTNTDLKIYTFKYKNEDFFNVFRSISNVLQSGEIRRGLYETDGSQDSFPLVEKINYKEVL